MAGTMIRQLAYGIPRMAEQGTPCAAWFEQGVQALDPSVAELTGSASREWWLDRMKQFEENQIGPVRKLLERIMGKGGDHPLLHQSIDWIEQQGDKVSASVRMLLADLYMAVGEPEKAKTAYAEALQTHRKSGSSASLIE